MVRRDWHYRASLAITGSYRQMDVRLLETFHAVVDHRSAMQAAAAVSAQIARLKSRLSFPLFDRSNKRLKPPVEGMLLDVEADKVLTGMDRLSEAAQHIPTAHPSPIVRACALQTSARVAHAVAEVETDWLPVGEAEYFASA